MSKIICNNNILGESMKSKLVQLFLKATLIGAMFILLLQSCTKANTKTQFTYMPANGNGIVASAGDITITEKELLLGIESDLYNAEKKIFEIKFNRLKALLIEKVMALDPKKKGMTNDEYLEKIIASTIKISDKEIKAFIKEKNIPKAHVNEQIKVRITEFLKVQKKKDAVDGWLGKKLNKTGVKVYIDQPARPVFDVKVGDSPNTHPKAKVTLVEFSDFQCPFCKKATETVQALKKKYGSKLNVVFKQYPLPFHNHAAKAAEAALCANDQGKFWQLHDQMFIDQSKLAVADIKTSAKKLGLNMAKFEKCLDSSAKSGEVKSNINEGQDVGVKSTPTFYINGQLLSGAQPLETFSELIDAELAK
jgi:protein-disulfide isomerase